MAKPLSRVRRDRVENQLRQGIGVSEIARNCRVSRHVVYNIKNEILPKPVPLAERTVVLRSELPWTVLKAMTHGFSQEFPEDQMHRTQCLGCKRPMWSKDPVLEDLCEECFFAQHLETAAASLEREVHGSGAGFDGGEGLFR